MILLSFGKWTERGGRWLLWKRIYAKGYIWTPFCRVASKRPATREYWNRVEKVADLLAIQQQSVTDEYMRGLYNGLELAIATMQDREPKYYTGQYTARTPNSFTFRLDHSGDDFEQIEQFLGGFGGPVSGMVPHDPS